MRLKVKIGKSLIWLIYPTAPILQGVDYAQFTIDICLRLVYFFLFGGYGETMRVDQFSKTDTEPLPCLLGDESATWQIRYLSLLSKSPMLVQMTKL